VAVLNKAKLNIITEIPAALPAAFPELKFYDLFCIYQFCFNNCDKMDNYLKFSNELQRASL
jgi:hypothetical protein